MPPHTSDSGPRAKRPQANKPGVDITLDRHWSSKAYTTGSKISGHVIINTQRDVAFDDFEVLFTGTAYTRIDFVNQYASATYAARPLMKLRMPINPEDLPSPRVFKAGRSYTLPFHFVVPHQLTLSACTHAVENVGIRDHHLRLPPTMGLWENNDQSPDMASIEYGIRASAFKDTAEEGRAMPLDSFHMIKVLPSLPEDAPLDINANDERYQLSKTKTVRKNIFSVKQGKLMATATQPGAIMLSPDALSASSTSLRVNLEFTAGSTEVAPPKINSAQAKLHSTTFFSSAPMSHLPNLGARIKHQTTPSLTYSATTPVTLAPLNTVTWENETPASRRDSGYSSSAWAEEEASDSDAAQRGNNKSKSVVRRFAMLDIPFSLPTGKNKIFLPTFYSCISARSYIVQLTLSVGANTSINLSIPVQIGVENMYEPDMNEDLPTFEAAMMESEGQEEVDSYFLPRRLQVPDEQYQNTSSPPGYNDFRSRPVAVA